MGEKSPREIEWYHSVTNSSTALVVRRIKDDMIDTLDFRSKLEIAISDILILPVCFPKVKPKVKQKIRRNKVRFHCLFAFRWIPNTKTLNTQFKIWNTQLSQKEVGKYPIASNPYLELWWISKAMAAFCGWWKLQIPSWCRYSLNLITVSVNRCLIKT